MTLFFVVWRKLVIDFFVQSTYLYVYSILTLNVKKAIFFRKVNGTKNVRMWLVLYSFNEK